MGNVKVTVFGHDLCHACQEAKEFFKDKNIDFDYKQLTDNLDFVEKNSVGDKITIPLIQICKQDSCRVVKGFNRVELEKELL